jgi:hypothetical protein
MSPRELAPRVHSHTLSGCLLSRAAAALVPARANTAINRLGYLSVGSTLIGQRVGEPISLILDPQSRERGGTPEVLTRLQKGCVPFAQHFLMSINTYPSNFP